MFKMKDRSSFPIHLSPNQKKCLLLTAQGYTVTSIAFQLRISTRMVAFHLSAAREKLGAASTAQAIHLAMKLHLLDEDD
jgi:LuxR family transcriptional regulator